MAVAVGAAVLLGLWWLAPTRYWISAAVDWLDDGRASAVVVFTAAYAVLAVLGVPTTLFVIAAGVLFGTGAGFASAQTGAITAAALSFLISRHVARDWVRINLMCRRRSRALLEVMDDEGWKMVVVTRLNPLLPASIKNYGFGLTRIRFGAYLLATSRFRHQSSSCTLISGRWGSCPYKARVGRRTGLNTCFTERGRWQRLSTSCW